MIVAHAINNAAIRIRQTARKIFMFPPLSENTANTVYWLGWSLVLLSAMLGLAGSALGFWGDKERERYSDLRLSENELETKRAVEGAAKANERAASLEKDATVARLELEQLKDKQRPREITKEQRDKFMEMVKDVPKTPVMVMFANNVYETTSFVQTVRYLLDEAGFGLPNRTYPDHMGIGYNPDRAVMASGVSLNLYYNPGEILHFPPLVESLQNAFNAARIPGDNIVMAELSRNVEPGKIEIFVRPKIVQ